MRYCRLQPLWKHSTYSMYCIWLKEKRPEWQKWKGQSSLAYSESRFLLISNTLSLIVNFVSLWEAVKLISSVQTSSLGATIHTYKALLCPHCKRILIYLPFPSMPCCYVISGNAVMHKIHSCTIFSLCTLDVILTSISLFFQCENRVPFPPKFSSSSPFRVGQPKCLRDSRCESNEVINIVSH